MKLKFLNSKDFWAGVMFLGTGSAAMIAAWSYPMGTTLRMGPGYFPSLLGGILVVIGLLVMVRSFKNYEKIQDNWSLRALIVLPLSMILFGVLMEYAGFVPALTVLIIGSSASSQKFKIVEVLLLTIFLTVLSIAVFIWGLGLPFPLIKGF